MEPSSPPLLWLRQVRGTETRPYEPHSATKTGSDASGHESGLKVAVARADVGGWWAGVGICQLCGQEQVMVWPDEANSGALECAACGAMAVMPEPSEASQEGSAGGD